MKTNPSFNNFDIITDGKFTGVFYSESKFCYTTNPFYFGIYNHKYFSMFPKYYVGTCINACSTWNDFRLATVDEINQFLDDCKNAGFEWSPTLNKFLGYNLQTKADFLKIKMPHYIPFKNTEGKTIQKIARNNYDSLMIIFNDGTYTSIQSSEDYPLEISNLLEPDYDHEDEWNGEHLISMYSTSNDFYHLSDDSIVTANTRAPWLCVAIHCLKFNFYDIKNKIVDDVIASIKNGEFSEEGSTFIDNNMMDVSDIQTLAIEHFLSMKFEDVMNALRRKKELEKIQDSQEYDL